MSKTPKWSTACLDWGKRLKAGRSIIPPPIFPAQAEEALKVFKELRIVDAAGSPTFGESCEQWVFDLVASIFGAYDKVSGRRLISEWLVLVPKKNSKSTIAAGIMQTALILNWRASARFTILAPTVEIAGNSFDPAKDMCAERVDEELNALLHTQAHTKTITHRLNGASLKVLAAETSTVGGSKSVGTLVDELWLFGEVAEAEDMLLEATGGLASRDEGFVIYLTTQGPKPPAGVFAAKLIYARGVRDGRIHDPRFQPVLFEFPPDMLKAEKHRDPKNWHMVNPNLGRSVSREFLERKFQEAKEAGEVQLVGWMAKHLNVEVGQARIAQGWSGAGFWERRADVALTLDEILRRCEVFTVGIDGGGLEDLLGLCVLGQERATQRWLAYAHAWAHPVALERRKSEVPKYKDFESDGDLTIIETLPGDVSAVAKVVARVEATGRLATVGMDPEKTHKIMMAALLAEDIPQEKLFGISQGWKLMGAITVTERKLAEGMLLHGGTRLMSWCVSNAMEEPRGNATLITKQASGKGKIDPLMAAFNAVSLMALNPEAMGSMDEWLSNPAKAVPA